jgi:hypothetical protein
MLGRRLSDRPDSADAIPGCYIGRLEGEHMIGTVRLIHRNKIAVETQNGDYSLFEATSDDFALGDQVAWNNDTLGKESIANQTRGGWVEVHFQSHHISVQDIASQVSGPH